MDNPQYLIESVSETLESKTVAQHQQAHDSKLSGQPNSVPASTLIVDPTAIAFHLSGRDNTLGFRNVPYDPQDRLAYRLVPTLHHSKRTVSGPKREEYSALITVFRERAKEMDSLIANADTFLRKDDVFNHLTYPPRTIPTFISGWEYCNAVCHHAIRKNALVKEETFRQRWPEWMNGMREGAGKVPSEERLLFNEEYCKMKIKEYEWRLKAGKAAEKARQAVVRNWHETVSAEARRS